MCILLYYIKLNYTKHYNLEQMRVKLVNSQMVVKQILAPFFDKNDSNNTKKYYFVVKKDI